MAVDRVISPFTENLADGTGFAPDRPRVDLAAYLERIGHQGEIAPTWATLVGLHLAHTTTAPFENLDILLGRGISLDLPDLERKLVRQRRGGYCFEHNLLFTAVLEDIGFGVTGLAARARVGAGRMLARTHMALRVLPADSGGVAFLADVGFGNGGLLTPLPIEPGEPVEQGGRIYQVTATESERVLWLTERGERRALYGFTTEPFFLADYLLANEHTSTSPMSVFTRELVVQRQRPAGRAALRGRILAVEDAAGPRRRALSDAAELRAALSEEFGLALPAEDTAQLWRRVGDHSPMGADNTSEMAG